MANRVGLELKELKVDVSAHVDVRGTLRADNGVPVAFQSFDVAVTMTPKNFVPGIMLDKLLQAAEYSCVVLQSLKSEPEVTVRRC